ncbi:GDP-mannose 4,6-dehydratase [Fusobacterium sp. PH5-44]|uniref:GDP-mannose 4,6-dehydratase n=1 Tax=unclassified Fusobacterium TaxID=2648384 RepID=UPI003D1D6543
MKKVLIVGSAGFVGRYLIDYLSKTLKWAVVATKMPYEIIKNKNIEIYNLDILDRKKIEELLNVVKPDVIFHLAAQSSVALSWKEPNLTIDININGSINLLTAVKMCIKPDIRVILIGSGEEYGYIKPNEIPITEENVLRPGNVYAATKACQNMLGKIYSTAYNMDIISIRAFNHIGPGQPPIFVVSDFCKQVSEIERNKRNSVINVGNLKVKRDFIDVRDVVKAYALIAELGESGETYNVGSGKAIEIEKILEIIKRMSKTEIDVKVDTSKLRPSDIPVIEADITKLVKKTKWKKEISLNNSLEDILNYWRKIK